MNNNKRHELIITVSLPLRSVICDRPAISGRDVAEVLVHSVPSIRGFCSPRCRRKYGPPSWSCMTRVGYSPLSPLLSNMLEVWFTAWVEIDHKKKKMSLLTLYSLQAKESRRRKAKQPYSIPRVKSCANGPSSVNCVDPFMCSFQDGNVQIITVLHSVHPGPGWGRGGVAVH